MDTTNEELGGPFLFRVWVTRGCYYVPSDRLRRKARYSVGSVAFLSFYVVVASIIQLKLLEQIPSVYRDSFSVVTLILSVFIIIVTLIESSKDYRVDAEHALQTAQKLTDLYNRIEVHAAGISPANEVELRKEYTDILVGARNTRRTIDYLWFQFDNHKEFKVGPGRMAVLIVGLLWNGFLEYWLYAAIVTVPPAIAVATLIGS